MTKRTSSLGLNAIVFVVAVLFSVTSFGQTQADSLKAELRFPPLTAQSQMRSIEQVQRTWAPFPETAVIENLALLGRRPDLEKRITRP